MATERWTEDEIKLALFLYFQLPFGKLHRGTPEIQELADAIGRTHSSVAMKLSNLASLDPNITGTGRKGLDGASKLDRQIFDQFSDDWTGLITETESLWDKIVLARPFSGVEDNSMPYQFDSNEHLSTIERLVQQRVGQSFFRQAVLANYDDRCCVTGISDKRLLNASHIRPWATDLRNRHNPSNGVALSPTLDRAFDRGLMSISATGKILISQQLADSEDADTRGYFAQYKDSIIRFPIKFALNSEFLNWHNDEIFLK